MLYFSLRSLFTEYGWQFLWRVALPHPLKTVSATLRALLLNCTDDVISIPRRDSPPPIGGAGSVVGVGFCLKPMDPPCPSGRFNHDCLYLEKLLGSEIAEAPACCRQCAIREIGMMALAANASLYIMTSAKEILFDVYLPALRKKRFISGLFVLCRYSFRPFAVGLLASDIRGWMVAFQQGDCADYKTWLRADRGTKDDQTTIQHRSGDTIRKLISGEDKSRDVPQRFSREGNVLWPE